MAESTKKIFISYSWTVQDRVIELAERLIANGVDVVLDVYDLKEGQDKYKLRTNPEVEIPLRKGEACEFEIFIKPLCSCKMEDQLMIVCLDLKEGFFMATTKKTTTKKVENK